MPLLRKCQLKKIALVIGNSEYAELPELRNAKQDARAIARVLSDKGFTVFLNQDANDTELKETLGFVSRQAANADQILIYYAGHSQIHNGVTHLLPVNVVSPNDKASIPISTVLEHFNIPFAQKTIILDTCLETGIEGAQNLYLPTVTQLETLLVFATSVGHAAYDGSGAHSVFTGALLDHLSKDTVDLQVTLQAVRNDVIRNSHSNQTPVSVSTLTQPYYLKADMSNSLDFGSQNDLIQSYSNYGYANKPLLNTLSGGVDPSRF